MKPFLQLSITSALTCALSAHDGTARPDAHAPISIMADHRHAAGEVMFSYRYMFMDMDEMRFGTDRVTPSEVYSGGNYIITPTRMTMEMHMLGMMYAPSDRFTLMAMLPYNLNEMDHLIAPGAVPLIRLNNGSRSFTTNSSGIGDLKLSTLVGIYDQGRHDFHAGIGVSIPTGSIGEKDVLPGPGGLRDRQLPASMQLGSGTIDLLPSLTYVYMADCWSTGIQAAGVYRTQTNAHDYMLGDRIDINAWASWRVVDWASLSAGLSYHYEDRLTGVQSDTLRNPPFAPARRTVPTVFGENYGGQRIEALVGANFVVPGGIFRNHRIAADLRLPLWRETNGYFLETDYTATVGWQYSF